jgi:hypothetical protein
MAVCSRNMSWEEGVIRVVAFLMELYCVSRYINATGCLNTILSICLGVPITLCTSYYKTSKIHCMDLY